MTGIAQKMFTEKMKKQPPGYRENKSSWPLMNRLLENKLLDPIDVLIAKKILSDDKKNEEAALFIAYLATALKLGHTCVKVENEIIPLVQEIWDENELFACGIQIEELSCALKTGAKAMPKECLKTVSSEDIAFETALCRHNNTFYFQKYWLWETTFKHHLKRLEEKEPTIRLDERKIQKELKQLQEDKRLLKEQASAIKNALLDCVSIISGGPGTGKTYTAGILIKVLWNALSDEEKESCRIIVAAPTGKAAATLKKSLQKVLSDIPELPLTEAKTLHALLKSFGDRGIMDRQVLGYDVVIVDESSMIDVNMMALLFSSVKEGSRLILLGDSHQLPPVEAGSLFTDMIQIRKEQGKQIGELTKCLRAESIEIVDLASYVYNGDVEGSIRCLENKHSSAVRYLETSEKSIRKKQEELIDHALESFLPTSEPFKMAPRELSAYLQAFSLLSPKRKGPFGVEELNALLLERWKRRLGTGQFYAPVMVIRNSASIGLYNGDIGLFVAPSMMLFPDRDNDEKIRRIPEVLVPEYEYAFCTSVHKSQGSEFDHVLLLMPDGADRFGREVFYTGITRAKKKLEIWGSRETIIQTIRRKVQRVSGLTN